MSIRETFQYWCRCRQLVEEAVDIATLMMCKMDSSMKNKEYNYGFASTELLYTT